MIKQKKYQVFHPDHETAIHYVLGMKNAINSENFAELFEKAGLLDKQADEWIPAQVFLDILNELEARGGAMLDLVSIGIRTAIDAQYPPEFLALPFEEKFVQLAQSYHYFQRGTNPGYWRTQLLSRQHVANIYRTPFPDDGLYGSIYGLAKRFLPTRMAFKVYYDPEIPRRELGGEETIIHVEWWEKDSK